jgi:hypothetical protein
MRDLQQPPPRFGFREAAAAPFEQQDQDQQALQHQDGGDGDDFAAVMGPQD